MQKRFDATPFQRSLELIPEEYCIALVGGRGGGKTWGAIRLIIRHCQHPDARVLVTRRRLKSLNQFQHETRMLTGAKWNGQDSTFTFDNGATVTLAHCESEAALLDIAQGMSYSMIVVDEAGASPAMHVIDELMLALRSPTLPTRVLLLANPGGANHAALSERHVNGHENGKPYKLGGRDWVTMLSTVDDNPHLPTEYHENFEQLRLSDPARYHAMRHGDWSAIVGAYFQGLWDAERMIVPSELLRPRFFKSLRIGADWGTASPAPFLLGGRLLQDIRLPDDRVLSRDSIVLVDEHVEVDPADITKGTGRSPSQIAPDLFRLAHRWNTRPKGWIDSAANARTISRHQDTVTTLFRKSFVAMHPCYKRGTRADRFGYLRELMATGMFYVSDRCRYWLATVPALPRDERDPEVPEKGSTDHAADATTYLVTNIGREVRSGNWSDGFAFGQEPYEDLPILDVDSVHLSVCRGSIDGE